MQLATRVGEEKKKSEEPTVLRRREPRASSREGYSEHQRTCNRWWHHQMRVCESRASRESDQLFHREFLLEHLLPVLIKIIKIHFNIKKGIN